MRRIALALTALLFLTGFGEADYEDGQKAANAGDIEQALSIWSELAKDGDAKSQYTLAAHYFHGEGVAQDREIAFFWYHQSATQGYLAGELALASLYLRGEGVPQNYGHAATWYQKCADRDLGLCQETLGQLYAQGLGVPQDRIQALKWLELAVERGIPTAGQTRKKVARAMLASDIAEAERLAREWEPKERLDGPQPGAEQ